MRRALLLLALLPSAAVEANVCHVATLDFLPAEQQQNDKPFRFPSQIVAWIEDASGTYVDTIYITQATGTYGLGNRPGRFDFNTAPDWPYGRRITVFPVWAQRQPFTYPLVVFQSGSENDLSHRSDESSDEHHYCQPMTRKDPKQVAAWDAGSCASQHVRTDKGIFDTAQASRYPPRNDLGVLGQDSPSVEMYAMLNPLDAVSGATPVSGMPATVSWTAPLTLPLPDGNYVLFVEVSRENDMNGTYNPTTYPPPTGISFGDYGIPYRGQPSVIYKVPFTFDSGDHTATTLDYIGYGDPDGLDGTIRPPDSTMNIQTGSGGGRFAVTTGGYRVRIETHVEDDSIAPLAPQNLAPVAIKATTAQLSFIAPGDDAAAGKPVKTYDVRMRVGEDITDANFASSSPVIANPTIAAPGTETTIDLAGLLPLTTYSIGVRATDDCSNTGPIATLTFTTTEPQAGEVEWCFVATAAYGSVMANDVDLLRRFRDALLRQSAVGELAIESYYTVGPAFAQAIGQSDLLRATARSFLAPLVGAVKGVRW